VFEHAIDVQVRGCVLQEEEGFSVHVGATRDGRYVTLTAASKTATEVHLMDTRCADSAPVLVHRRTAGVHHAPQALWPVRMHCIVITASSAVCWVTSHWLRPACVWHPVLNSRPRGNNLSTQACGM
jgi:hypothetical protein